MSTTYGRTVDKREIRIIVNSDWSGDAEIVIEDRSVTPYRIDRATCPARELVVGDPHTVVSGSLNTVGWMAAAALAAHWYAVTRMREAFDQAMDDVG